MIRVPVDFPSDLNVLSQANEERKNGYKISINVMKKNKKFQKELLAKDGYEEIREFFAD